MLYDYVCNNCGNEMIDVEQSIKDKALRRCSECNKDGLQRVIYGGQYASVRGEATTVGQAIERSTKERKNKFGSDCDYKPKETPENPHLTASPKEIMKMNEKQKRKYIMEGRT